MPARRRRHEASRTDFVHRREPHSPWGSWDWLRDLSNSAGGIDFHLDWGASQFISKQAFIGLVGYAYQQITDDFGQHPALGGFRSRVLGIGPQIGILFPVGDMQGYLNLKAYGEFAAENRAAGWNTWFSVAPVAPTSTLSLRRRVVAK